MQIMLDAALVVAMDVVLTNRSSHSGLSRELQSSERMEGEKLLTWLQGVKVRVQGQASLRTAASLPLQPPLCSSDQLASSAGV